VPPSIQLLRLFLGFGVCFWLWAKWLFSPQLVFLPPLPPVEVFLRLVETVLGRSVVVLIPLLGFLLVFSDGYLCWREGRLPRWKANTLRGAAEVVIIHVGLCWAGTLVFFGIFALMPGSEVWGKGLFDPVVRGLVLFASFLALIMAGPVTGLAVGTRSLMRRSREVCPPTCLAALNTTVGAILLVLLVLWVVAGGPKEIVRGFG
jgi:hypothetical protein